MTPPTPSSSSAEESFRAALRADPTRDPVRLAKSIGLSGRARRRIVLELESEGVLARRSRARLRLAAAVGTIALGGGLYFGFDRSEPPPAAVTTAEPERKPMAAEAVAAERALYNAIDERDPSRMVEAVAQLQSPDEPIRLAALRYLVTVQAKDHIAPMLSLLEDPSSRVRSSAIQLLASFPGEAVDARLAGAVIDEQRALSERTLAVGSLEQRQIADPGLIARALVPGLLTESLPLREATVELISRLARRTTAIPTKDKVALHAAWQGLLGVAE